MQQATENIHKTDLYCMDADGIESKSLPNVFRQRIKGDLANNTFDRSAFIHN